MANSHIARFGALTALAAVSGVGFMAHAQEDPAACKQVQLDGTKTMNGLHMHDETSTQIDGVKPGSSHCVVVSQSGYNTAVKAMAYVYYPEGKTMFEGVTAGIDKPPFQTLRKKTLPVQGPTGPAIKASWEFEVGPGKPTVLVMSFPDDGSGDADSFDGFPIFIFEHKTYGAINTTPAADGAEGIDDPVGLEFDKFGPRNIVRATTEVQQKAGFEKPCMVRLRMHNSQSKAEMEIAMDHEGPILPGTYDVVVLDKGKYKPTEKHPGEFVVTFGLGDIGNYYLGNRQITYGAVSGSVEITAFSPDLMQGHLNIVGQKEASGYLKSDERAQYAAAPNSIPVSAVFNIIPQITPPLRTLTDEDNCFDPDPIKWYEPSKDEKDDKEKKTTEDTGSRKADPAEFGSQPDPAPASTETPDEATTPDGVTPSPATAAGANVPGECRPLYFAQTRPFTENPGLPFSFDIPADWTLSYQDGSSIGQISSPDYPSGGIKYNVQRVGRPDDVEKYTKIWKVMHKPLGTLTYQGEEISAYGSDFPGGANLYFMLPRENGHFMVEMMFLGLQTCDVEPVESTRDLVLSTFRAN